MGNWKPLFASVCIGMALLGCTSKEMPKKEADQVSEGEIQQISWVKEPFAAYETDPIALYDKGFLVNDGNREGFINANGDLLLAMKYKFQACFIDDAYGVMEGGDGDLKYLSQLFHVEGYDQGCWTGIVGPQTSYYVDDKGENVYAIRYDMNTSAYVEEKTDLETICADIKADGFFLPVNLKITGEEDGKDSRTEEGFVLVTKGKLHSETVYEAVHMKERVYRPHMALEALNAVKKDGKWAIMDKTGKLISDFAYAAADVLNDTYVKVEKKPYIGLYTKDQKEYLYEGIESITAPSQRVVFAKQNDLWGLMKLTE